MKSQVFATIRKIAAAKRQDTAVHLLLVLEGQCCMTEGKTLARTLRSQIEANTLKPGQLRAKLECILRVELKHRVTVTLPPEEAQSIARLVKAAFAQHPRKRKIGLTECCQIAGVSWRVRSSRKEAVRTTVYFHVYPRHCPKSNPRRTKKTDPP